MRYATVLLLSLAACSADPVLLPDAGPCNGSCGAGTVCQSGACVAVDSGAADVMPGDAGALDAVAVEDHPVAADRGMVPVDVGMDAGIVDAGTDTGPADTGVDVDLRGSEVCRGVLMVCDGRQINVQGGETDGGRVYHCGGCGRTCGAGEFCINCNCVRP